MQGSNFMNVSVMMGFPAHKLSQVAFEGGLECFEADVGDVSCTRCPELMSTLGAGATSADDCQCQACSAFRLTPVHIGSGKLARD